MRGRRCRRCLLQHRSSTNWAQLVRNPYGVYLQELTATVNEPEPKRKTLAERAGEPKSSIVAPTPTSRSFMKGTSLVGAGVSSTVRRSVPAQIESAMENKEISSFSDYDSWRDSWVSRRQSPAGTQTKSRHSRLQPSQTVKTMDNCVLAIMLLTLVAEVLPTTQPLGCFLLHITNWIGILSKHIQWQLLE